ncbi:MAG: diguanylate cyclase [Gemmataceae bacterium]
MRPLFHGDALKHWDMLEAESFSHARYLLQYEPADALLVHQDLLDSDGAQGLSWLASHRKAPVVFLSQECLTSAALAYELGASLCLSMQEALAHPLLLAKSLERAVYCHAIETQLDTTRERLARSRRHVDRLVNVMWRMTPTDADSPWFSQRHMMERLDEEIARSKRHKAPLTIALGELSDASTDEGTLPHWTVEAILKTKRRDDVVGQYGKNGFLLLLVHTPVQGGMHCVRRLQKIIEHDRAELQAPHRPRAYFGLTGADEKREDAIALLRAAEEGLDTARREENERIAVG